jgi:hypothetical protein
MLSRRTSAREVKNYIVDYWGMKDKMLMVQMQMQNGKMGRGNKAYFDAMVQQLPSPGTADATMARRQLRNFNETLSSLKERYGELADVPAADIHGDVGEPKTGKSGAELSPAGAAYLDSILGKGH